MKITRSVVRAALAGLLLLAPVTAHAALTANSQNDVLVTTSPFTMPTTGTLCLDLKPNWAQTSTDGHTIVGISDFDTNYLWIGHDDAINGNGLFIRWITGWTYYAVVASSYTLNQSVYNRLCGTWDSTAQEVKLYLNGQQIGGTTTSLVTWDTSAQYLHLGNCWWDCANLDGDIAEVAIWNRVLTGTELTNRMSGLLSSCTSSGLVAYWPLPSTSDVTDHAGSADLTNSNMTNASAHPSTTECGPGGGGGGESFPTLGVLDAFTRGDGAIGGSWVAWPLLGTDLAVSSNAAAGTVSGFSGNLYGVAYGPDVEVFATITTLPAEGTGVGLTWRQSTTTSTDTRYYINISRVTGSNNDTISFGKAVAGSYTEDIGGVIDLGFDLATGDQVGVRMRGAVVVIYHCRPAGTCTQVGQRSDSSITAAGYLGLFIEGTTARMDDFGGGTFVVPTGAVGIIGGGVGLTGIID